MQKILFVLASLAVFFSCTKENVIPYSSENQLLTVRSGEDITVLGDKLTNPFTVTNVRAAYAELYSDQNVLDQTHTYIRFLPSRWI